MIIIGSGLDEYLVNMLDYKIALNFNRLLLKTFNILVLSSVSIPLWMSNDVTHSLWAAMPSDRAEQPKNLPQVAVDRGAGKDKVS